MLVIGLTGGIGSGKSTVAALFAEKDIAIIDTDQIAREITRPNQPASNQIIQRFGPQIVLPNGTLDRAQLRKIIFAQDADRTWLEQLLHPIIRLEARRQAETAQSAYCIIVVPLLLENKTFPLVQRVLVVDTDPDTQITRTTSRDKISNPKEVEAIVQAQIDREQRLQLADDVIENSGTVEDLIPQVNRLHEFYLSLAKNYPNTAT